MEEVKNEKVTAKKLAIAIINLLVWFNVALLSYTILQDTILEKANKAKIESYKLAKEAYDIAYAIREFDEVKSEIEGEKGKIYSDNVHLVNWEKNTNFILYSNPEQITMSNEKCYLVNLFLSKRPVEEIKAEDLDIDQCELNK